MPNAGLIVVVDANVLYPARLRDLFIRLSIAGLIRPKWSERILDECFSNLIADRPDLTTRQLDRTRRLMNEAVPDATLHEARRPGPTLDLPDPDDHHVVDTAIAADADCIVTANRRLARVVAPHREGDPVRDRAAPQSGNRRIRSIQPVVEHENLGSIDH